MDDLYFGLPPPVSKKSNPDIRKKPNFSFETISTIEGSDTWNAFIDSLIKHNNMDCDKNESDIQLGNKDDELLDLEYNPASPNVYIICPAKNEPTLIKQTISTEETEVNFKIGKMLLEKMGWRRGEGLGKSNQGIKIPITICRKKNFIKRF